MIALGPALVLSGLAWFVLGIVAMHVVPIVELPHDAVLLDVVFHSSGLWVAALGFALTHLPRQELAA